MVAVIMKTYFIADTHFFHFNIIKYCQRPFYTADEMNSAMIQAWNSKVAPFDHVWHLGDFGFSKNAEAYLAVFNSLNGIKHLIKGNHDPKVTIGEWDSVDDYKEITINKHSLVIFHYPIASWNGKFKGAYHFYGHVHGELHLGKNALDVGVDNIGYAPIELEDAVDLASSHKEAGNDSNCIRGKQDQAKS
jgi:calcineurin-like phosphoesterase family protein